MHKIKNMLEQDIQKILKNKYNVDFPKIIINDIKDDKGDYAIPCFVFAKQIGANPTQIAQELETECNSINYIKNVSAVNGFLNIAINQEKLALDNLELIVNDPNSLSNNIGNGKKYLVEYSSPNIAKPFSVGHLRTTIIGNAIKNIAIKNGYNVTSINHLGDWGTQFGKLITAYKLWGSKEMVESAPIDSLLSLYIKFHEEVETTPELDSTAREWFKKLEDGDQEATELWKWFKDESMQEFSQTYDLLDIKFDSYAGESFYTDKMEPVIQDLKDRNLLKEDNDAMIVDLGDSMPPALILKNDGATLYMTRDLAAAHYRKQTYDFEKCIYVVGSEQSLHFKQLKEVLLLSGNEWANDMEHVSFGMVLQGGKKMSTRKGKIIKLHELLLESIDLAKEKIQIDGIDQTQKNQIAKDIGIGAILYNDLKNYRTNDIEFDLESALRFEGNTGPYIQYSIVRINSVLNKNEYVSYRSESKYFEDENVNSLLNIMNNYNKVLADALNEYDPSLIAKYVYELARAFSKTYSKINVSNMENNLEKNFMLNLFNAVRKILIDGLNTLGIKSVEKM